jgi:predicted alpha/beta superfamily hydrolase
LICLCYGQNENNIVIGNSLLIHSKILDKDIRLSVHVPNNRVNSEAQYPVLYIFQTHFEQVSGAVKHLYDYKLTPPIMVVSIDNYEFGWLTPTKVERNPNSGKADIFLQFFEKELFAFIDSKYHTHPYRIIFSNSWGAMFAAYSIIWKPHIFNAAIASIPWLPYDGEKRYILNNTVEMINSNEYHNFLYMSMDNETEIIQDLESFIDILRMNPKTGLEWEYHLWPEEDHTSTPYRSIYSGLRSLYKEWSQIPEDILALGLNGIKQYEIYLNQKFGYSIGLSPQALRMAGQKHERDDRHAEAIEIYRFAIEKSPNDSFLYVTLGRAYEQINEFQLAKKAYEEGYQIAISTSNPQVKWVKNFLDKINQKISDLEK